MGNLTQSRRAFFLRLLLVALLTLAPDVPCFSAGPPAKADPHTTGILEGKLTDNNSVPLAEAAITVRNLTTGSTAQSTTGKNGSYHFAALDPGEYSLEANLPSSGRGQVSGILVSAGHATKVQAALLIERPHPLSTARRRRARTRPHRSRRHHSS